MAVARIRTGLPLDRFAELAGVHPLHFNQITRGTCGDPILQHGWQMDGSEELIGRIGREDVAIAIQQAESMIEGWLGHPLVPRWIEDEEGTFPWSGGGGYPALTLGWHKYISGGIEQLVEIESGVGVTYVDSDGDGYPEVAEITLTGTNILNAEEYAVFYPGEGGDGSTAWEIRHIRKITVTPTGGGLGNVTIQMRREQFVLPELITSLDAMEVDGDLDANFLETVDVYRRYNDPQRQVQFLWPNPQCGICAGAGCASCSYTTQWGCLRAINARDSFVSLTPATWNADTLEFDSAAWSGYGRPSRARLWYLAGHQDFKKARPLVDMADHYAMAVTMLALSLLPGPLCLCTSRSFAKWSEDFARQESDVEGHTLSFKTSRRVIDNPLGTTAGAKAAYELLRNEKVGEAANYAFR